MASVFYQNFSDAMYMEDYSKLNFGVGRNSKYRSRKKKSNT